MVKIQVNSQGKAYYTSTGKVLLAPEGSITITENGTHNVTSYAEAVVNVPNPSTGTLTITENGTHNVTAYAEAVVNVPSGSGGDVTLTRISDDNGNEIGTYFANFEDDSGNKYKVICLDAIYRRISGTWCSNTSNVVTNMPKYDNSFDAWWYDDAKETATQNTQLILDYCSAGDFTSTACSHCRSISFTIDGATYYGQLPNMRELFDLWRCRTDLESMDITASSKKTLNLTAAGRKIKWSSSQSGAKYGWALAAAGRVQDNGKASGNFVIPVLEIPKE